MQRFIKYVWFVAIFVAQQLSAQGNVYIVGGFNNWDALNPQEFTYADGVFTTTVDFSNSKEFKLSTTCGNEGNGWNEFDVGTMIYSENPVANKWLTLEEKPVSQNLKAPSEQTYTIIVDLEGMRLMFEEPGGTHSSFSGTLPVLYINTANYQDITDKETYLDATYYLDPMGVDDVEAIGSAESPLSLKIKGRGNYTWTSFNKKPYRLKFAEKASPLGMPASKHFVLLAHADDQVGFMRNECGFTASKLLEMPWTPESLPIELVLNGNYRGLYFLTQNIRISKERVNITEQDDLATTNVDGGWLVEIDNYDSDPHITIYENGNNAIWFTYKSPEELSTEQETYLTSQMQALDDAIYASNKNDASTLKSLIDFDILARYYITQEILDDTESFHGSCYLNRDQGELEKWKFGPVWDFGNAFGRSNHEQFIWQNPSFSQVWIGEIYKYGEFVDAVKDIWAWWLGFGPEALYDHIDEFADKIEIAAQYDAIRWPDYGNSDVKSKAANFKTLIADKIDWLKKQWGSEASVTNIVQDSNTPTDVYNLQGILVLKNALPEQINNLPKGIYITRFGKILVN